MNTPNIVSILHFLRPEAEWVTSIETGSLENDYNTVEWHDKKQTKPTLEEVNEVYPILLEQEPMRRLKEYRNILLYHSDWSQTPDIPESLKTPWAEYRQKLRDLPNTSNPILCDESEHPSGVTNVDWPIPPSN